MPITLKKLLQSSATSKIDPINNLPTGKPVITSSNSKFEEGATLSIDLSKVIDNDGLTILIYGYLGLKKLILTIQLFMDTYYQ